MKMYLISIVIPILILVQSCKRPCIEASYRFSMLETFAPEIDSIRVGDTLSLASAHSTTFIDTSNGKATQINFSNSLLGVNIRILQLSDSSNSAIGAVPNFKIIKINGSETGNDNIPSENKGFYYQELNNEYLLKLNFIALRKGVYLISVGNSMGIIKGNKGCVKANFEIDNGNTNNHLYFYQNFFQGTPVSDYTRRHIYRFKVY